MAYSKSRTTRRTSRSSGYSRGSGGRTASRTGRSKRPAKRGGGTARTIKLVVEVAPHNGAARPTLLPATEVARQNKKTF